MDHPQGVLRTGDRATVQFEFISHPEFIKEGMKLLFREGKTKVCLLHVGSMVLLNEKNRGWVLSLNYCSVALCKLLRESMASSNQACCMEQSIYSSTSWFFVLGIFVGFSSRLVLYPLQSPYLWPAHQS